MGRGVPSSKVFHSTPPLLIWHTDELLTNAEAPKFDLDLYIQNYRGTC